MGSGPATRRSFLRDCESWSRVVWVIGQIQRLRLLTRTSVIGVKSGSESARRHHGSLVSRASATLAVRPHPVANSSLTGVSSGQYELTFILE